MQTEFREQVRDLQESLVAERVKATQLERKLSLAEEGLANAMQEIELYKHYIGCLMVAYTAEVTEAERLRNELTGCQLERDRLKGVLFRHACHCGRQGEDPEPHSPRGALTA